jgi:hypothetical protein
MDQGSIAIYVERKGFSVQVIHEELVTTFHPDAVVYSTVTSCLRETLFALVCQLTGLRNISAAKVYRQLTQSLGFTTRHLYWILYLLSAIQKQERVQQA